MFALPKLPYAEDALAPHLSEATLSFHHGKHHKAYIDKLNDALRDNPLSDATLAEVILQSRGDVAKQAIFNNAAQCWNHEFLWNSMVPDGGGPATGVIKRLIDENFGDEEAFGEAFTEAAVGHFGSGWIWLVINGNKFEIITTHDADLPLVHGGIALVTCDLWEHAYYLDYQNRRPEFVRAFLDNLINWSFANANLEKANVSETV
jgi:superoxide dismutase, Fe-Mn family